MSDNFTVQKMGLPNLARVRAAYQNLPKTEIIIRLESAQSMTDADFKKEGYSLPRIEYISILQSILQ